MLSRGEIKKCGFKPMSHEDQKLIFPNVDWKVYMRGVPGATAYLHHKDEKEGLVEIVVQSAFEEAKQTGSTGWDIKKFEGKIPARHELQIILRCTGIA